MTISTIFELLILSYVLEIVFVTLHEFSHAIVAIIIGMDVEDIDLYFTRVCIIPFLVGYVKPKQYSRDKMKYVSFAPLMLLPLSIYLVKEVGIAAITAILISLPSKKDIDKGINTRYKIFEKWEKKRFFIALVLTIVAYLYFMY